MREVALSDAVTDSEGIWARPMYAGRCRRLVHLRWSRGRVTRQRAAPDGVLLDDRIDRGSMVRR